MEESREEMTEFNGEDIEPSEPVDTVQEDIIPYLIHFSEEDLIPEIHEANMLGVIETDEVEGERLEDLLEMVSNPEPLEEIYREKAEEVITQKVRKFENEIEGEYGKIHIKNQKTRWESCKAKDNLSSNWRIVMAPEFVFDYIVTHELAHLEHSDHSQT